jgi:hypothetical protein
MKPELTIASIHVLDDADTTRERGLRLHSSSAIARVLIIFSASFPFLVFDLGANHSLNIPRSGQLGIQVPA